MYVSGLAPDLGETASALVGNIPAARSDRRSRRRVMLADGNQDLYIMQDKYHAQFAADVPAGEAKLMAATQRPIVAAAFDEPAGAPAWKTIPSWFLYGSLDRNIPPAVHAFLAQRAGARKSRRGERRITRRDDFASRRAVEADRRRSGIHRRTSQARRGFEKSPRTSALSSQAGRGRAVGSQPIKHR